MQLSRERALLFAAAIVAAQGVILFLMGQPSICECGFVKVWEGVVASSGNSQHISDWYTFSHIIHGLLFYLALWYFFPRLSIFQRFVLAIGIEAAWEIAENTPMVIEHYRQQALAQGYVGDSVLNSVVDTLAAAVGFVLAWRLPVSASVALALFFEAFVAFSIRDNLTLNVLGFFHQFEFISEWQSAK